MFAFVGLVGGVLSGVFTNYTGYKFANDLRKDLFKKIYLYRPVVDKIDGNLYHFYCSHHQIMHYFKRFGADAMIISPIELAESMKKYYYLASVKYSEKIAKLKNK